MYFQEMQNRINTHNKITYHTIFRPVCPLLRIVQILIFCKHTNIVALLIEN